MTTTTVRSTTIRSKFRRSGRIALGLTVLAGGAVAVSGGPSNAAEPSNVAVDASPSASYTASWNNIASINDGVAVNTGSDTNAASATWATWSEANPESQWLQYTWTDEQTINESEITFWHDVSPGTGTSPGVAVPSSWTARYLDDDGDWQTLPGADAYGTSETGSNITTFTPVTTTAIRATFQASQDAEAENNAVGVSEWEITGIPDDDDDEPVTPAPTLSVSDDKVLDLGLNGDLTDETGLHEPTMQTGTASYVTGVDGQALSFNGSSAVKLGTASDLQPEDMTLSFWLKPTADMGSSEQMITWAKDSAYTSDGWYLSSLNATTPLALSVGPSVVNGEPYLVSIAGQRSTFFPTGEWTHVVVTYDHATKTVKFFRNGVRQESVVQHAITESSTGVLSSESTSTKTIGYSGPGYQGAFLRAALDDYRIYDGVATSSDVVKLTQENDPTFDPAAVASDDLDDISLPSTTTTDLTLPTSGARGSDITWTSSDTSHIANDGTVTQPTDADAPVILTAHGTYGDGEATRTFDITVLTKTNDDQVIEVAETSVRTTTGVQPTLPTEVDVVSVGGSVTPTAVDWETISDDDLTDGHDFSITGTLSGFRDNVAIANIYVRDTLSSTITEVADVAVITAPGVVPSLPATVAATYDDDAVSSTVAVTWEDIHSRKLTPGGPYELTGAVQSWAGSATAFIFVDDTAPGVSSAGAAVEFGQTVDIDLQVSGITAPTGTLTLLDGATELGTDSVADDGTATITLASQALEAGTHQLLANYSGDDTEEPLLGRVTVEVTDGPASPVAAVATIVAPVATVTYGKIGRITVKLTGAAGTPTGTVTVGDTAKTIAAGTLSSGSVSFTLAARSLEVGRHNFSVTYSGDATYARASGTATVAVSKATSAISGKTKGKIKANKTRAVLTIKVTAAAVRPSGRVTVIVGTRKLRAKLTRNGTATLRLPRFSSAGTKRVTLRYGGDPHVSGSAKTIKVTVRR